MKHNLFQIALFLIFASLIFSCQKIDQLAENFKFQKKSASEIPNNFPKEISILLPTQYRKKSTGYPKNAKDENWMEIYKDEKSGKWIIGKADLQISYGRDECVGEDVMIIKSKNKDAALFFTNFECLMQNPETVLENISLFPEHPVSFKLNGENYSLSSKGNVLDDKGYVIPANFVSNQTDQELADSQIKNYSLSFFGDAKNIELFTSPEIKFTTPKIIWLGDLNGDHLPDMILDLSEFYEAKHFYFFLSDPSDKENPLKKLADLQVVNDC